MARVEDRVQPGQPGDGIAQEIPSKNLPPVPYRDLPEPLPLKKIVGASVILLATSIGSGEFVLWPFIASQVGLVAMWAALVGITIQYFINMEIERYTLATGETAVTGFTRLWKGWAPLFIIMTVVPWAWPGWATGASTSLSYVFGWSEDAVVPVTVVGLLAIGIALTVSPVVYQTVEKFQMVMVAIIVVFLVVAVVIATDGSHWGDFATGFSNFGSIPSEIGAATLLGALAFAGAGGSVNLAQSNWIRDKGMGMGGAMPRIVSPFTGEEVSRATTGFFFRQTPENMSRWNAWWKVSSQEQFWTFLVIGGLSIIILSVLTYATVFGREGLTDDFSFIQLEGEVLKDTIAPWFGSSFWIAGTVILLSTNLGVIDHVGRVVADVLKVNWLRDNEFWSESKLYFALVWGEIAFGCIILLAGVTQPLVLLVIASSLNGIVMFVYSGLLLQLNRGVLPAPIQMKGLRLVMLGISTLFFGYFSVQVVIDQFGQL
jgi:hypothetical protein